VFFRMLHICKNDLSYIAPPFLFYCGYFSSHFPTLSTLLYWNTLPGWYWPPSWVTTYEMVPEEVCGFVLSDLPVLFPTTYTWVFVCPFLMYYIGSWACTHLRRRIKTISSSIYDTRFTRNIHPTVQIIGYFFKDVHTWRLLSI